MTDREELRAEADKAWAHLVDAEDVGARARFIANVDMLGPVPENCTDLGRCWVWTRYRNEDGYGSVRFQGTMRRAHRVSFYLANGHYPVCAMHRCSTRECVNPRHIFEGAVLDRESLFWSSVNKHGPTPEHRLELGPCWVWTGRMNVGGYGCFHLGGLTTAHRVSFYLARGSYPNAGTSRRDMGCVLHHCDNRACVNPDHLFEGSYKDNAVDMTKKGRRFVMRAPGETNPRAVLTADIVETIRSLRGVMTHKHIAARFGIARRTVTHVLNRTSWRHIP